MVSSNAASVGHYLASVPADRRAELQRVRSVVNARLPPGFREGMLYGMIGWYIPLPRYPNTYNGEPLCLAALAAQKRHLALYLMTVYGDRAVERDFRAGFKAAGKKLDMGKSCVRFSTADSLALGVIGRTIARASVEDYIARYELARGKPKKSDEPPPKPGAKPKADTATRKPKSKSKSKSKPKPKPRSKPRAAGRKPKAGAKRTRTATRAKPRKRAPSKRASSKRTRAKSRR